MWITLCQNAFVSSVVPVFQSFQVCFVREERPFVFHHNIAHGAKQLTHTFINEHWGIAPLLEVPGVTCACI